MAEAKKNGAAKSAAAVTEAQKKVRRKKKAKKNVTHGVVHIQATYNNTIVSITDTNGNTLAWSSAGKNGFKGPKKATPYAASIIVKDAIERVREMGLQEVDVIVRGIGAGREGAIRALNINGIKVLGIRDLTPVPHNGCRPPRPRRV